MPGLKPSEVIWRDGELIPWEQATIHVGTHALHYGSSVFEGIRCYKTETGSAMFRLPEHIRRLLDSAKIYRMPVAYDQAALVEACADTVRANGFFACYVRPIAFRGYHSLGVNPAPCPVETYIMVWEWGSYLGEEGLQKGVDVKVATWNRMAPNTLPSLAKSGANYMSSQLMHMEALQEGFAEAVALDPSGYVSEGSGENIFVVRDGVVYTPPIGASVLSGITRDSAIVLLGELGYEVKETNIPRELLYIADEVFFTGTAAEVTPIRTIDRVQVGEGVRGPVTTELQRRYLDIAQGRVEDRYEWLTPVRVGETAMAAERDGRL